MRLLSLVAPYLKIRAYSWLSASEQVLYVRVLGTQVAVPVAAFSNGRHVEPEQAVPDTVPPEWSQGQEEAEDEGEEDDDEE